jgi:FAD/FMN-containing dehydrogenase
MSEGVELAVIDDLRSVVGDAHVLTDAASRAPHEVDWTGRFRGSTPAVVRPGSTAEVAAIVHLCRRERVAIVPQGGNTGMVGGGVPLAGEVVVDLRRLDDIGPVDVAARQVTVGAGVTIEALQHAAAAAGLRYAVDFGSRGTATVGGSIATNAGGINVIRHGSTRQQVVGIEAVLGTGDVISRLSGLEKDNTGYHLPSLLCGSEGTLGIITAARLRLVSTHEHRVTALVGFGSVDDAVGAVAAWRASLDSFDAIEIMLTDGVAMVCRAFELASPLAQRWTAVVLVEASAHDDPTVAVAAAIAATPEAGEVAVATDDSQRSALWRLREDHTLAIATIGVPHKFDVTLPISRLGRFMADVPGVVAEVEPAARTWQFGHVGDGNIHVNVTGATGDDDVLDEHVYRFVVACGGCISAEHGIGTAKARWLHLDRSAAEIGAMRALKRALDPDGVLNPNAVTGT